MYHRACSMVRSAVLQADCMYAMTSRGDFRAQEVAGKRTKPVLGAIWLLLRCTACNLILLTRTQGWRLWQGVKEGLDLRQAWELKGRQRVAVAGRSAGACNGLLLGLQACGGACSRLIARAGSATLGLLLLLLRRLLLLRLVAGAVVWLHVCWI